MDPEFQRDFIWDSNKQSKFIQSVLMRIPLPVFYLAEDKQGRGSGGGWFTALVYFPRILSDGKLSLENSQDQRLT